jgi:glycosyltransferase involved in cell wall biosynthesis
MRAAPPPAALLLNGRFLTQAMTGVQRFATEITRAADALAMAGAWPPTRVLVPPGTALPGYAALKLAPVGRGGGQLWEQRDLPRAVRDGMLLNLGNTAPLRVPGAQQAVVIHDAGVFDTPESYSLPFRAWYRLLHHGLARRGARLLTVSAFSQARIAQRLGIPPHRIGVVPEGAEHALRVPADAGVLARHGLAPGRFALVVGTAAAHKNLRALAAAAALLGRHGMVLAVAGGDAGGLFRAADGAGGAAVRPLGRVTDAELRALYEAALALVFPSRYEGFGLPPVEAMACGCPVVAARSGAVPEVCGEAALWFDAADPDGAAAALARLLDEQGLGPRLRQAGLARAAPFTWRAAAQRLLDLIREAPPA